MICYKGTDDPPLGEEQPGVRKSGVHEALLLGPAQEGIPQGGRRPFSGDVSGLSIAGQAKLQYSAI